MPTQFVSPYDIKIVKPSKDRVFRNPRKTFKQETLNELEERIRSNGLITTPTCREINGEIELVAGERRLRCIVNLLKRNAKCWDKEAKKWSSAKEVYEHLEVAIRKCKDDREAITIAVSENLDREDVPEMDLVEFCLYLETCEESDGSRMFSRSDMEDLLGRSQPWISQTISLQNLPDTAKKKLQEGAMNRTAALELLQTDPTKINKVLRHAKTIRKEEVQNKIIKINEEIQEAHLELEKAQKEYNNALCMGNANAASGALKRINKSKARKEEAIARKKILNNQNELTITTGAVQQANRELGVTNGAAKPMTMKHIRVLREELEELLVSQKKKKEYQIIAKTLDMVLGKTPSDFEEIVNAA